MLRITIKGVKAGVSALQLKLEGHLAGVWVRHLEICWRAARSSFGPRLTGIDLTGCRGVDRAGRYLLALLHEEGSRLIPGSFEMTNLVEAIARDWPAEAAHQK